MRAVPIRTVFYLAAFALPALAQVQPPVRTSSEMPHVEVSAGVAGIEASPGAGLEMRMVDLGLRSSGTRGPYPYTDATNILPGGFMQVNVALTEHTMAGVLAEVMETTTHGRTPDGLSVSAHATTKTRALLASFRPTPWIKVEAGPALLHRVLEFESTGVAVADDTIGVIAGADAKFMRRRRTPEHPPIFGFVTAQYRAAPVVPRAAMAVPLYGSLQPHEVRWSAQHLRSSHWMFGVGFGFEI